VPSGSRLSFQPAWKLSTPTDSFPGRESGDCSPTANTQEVLISKESGHTTVTAQVATEHHFSERGPLRKPANALSATFETAPQVGVRTDTHHHTRDGDIFGAMKPEPSKGVTGYGPIPRDRVSLGLRQSATAHGVIM
jgi:hypothetical protein